MTSSEFREIAKTVHEFGFSKVRIGNVVIYRDKVRTPKVKDEPKNEAPIITTHPAIQQVQSLLKLEDTELVDKLFPDHQEETA